MRGQNSSKALEMHRNAACFEPRWKLTFSMVHVRGSKSNHGPCTQAWSGATCFALKHVQRNPSFNDHVQWFPRQVIYNGDGAYLPRGYACQITVLLEVGNECMDIGSSQLKKKETRMHYGSISAIHRTNTYPHVAEGNHKLIVDLIVNPVQK